MRAQIIYNQSQDQNKQKIFNIDLLASNKIGPQGLTGDSAYKIAKNHGYEGTEEEWLISLIGPKGDSYILTQKDKEEIADTINEKFEQSINKTAQQIDQKIKNIQDSIPLNISQLNNDADYINKAYVDDELATKQDTLPFATPTAADVGKALMPKTVENGEVTEWEFGEAGMVDDVQINGTSILENKVANIPIATASVLGAVKSNPDGGIKVGTNGNLATDPATTSHAKLGTNAYKPVVPSVQHASTFYGLAKAAGDTTQSQSSNAVGTYTDAAKQKILTMLGVDTAISNAISDITSFEFQVVEEDYLPSVGKKGIIYLLKHHHKDGDVYDEFIWVNGSYEKIGNTDIELIDYALKSEIPTNVSQLTNDSNYQTLTQVNEAIANVDLTDRIAKGTGQFAVVMGDLENNVASEAISHAEGGLTKATAVASHAEGYETTASGIDSHAEGNATTASGMIAHAEGYATVASGMCSHSEGVATIANASYQHVFGTANIPDTPDEKSGMGKYVEIVGNSINPTSPSNARTLDWEGNQWLAGTLKVGGTSYDDATEVATIDDLSTAIDGTIQIQIVEELPENGSNKVIYVMGNSSKTRNPYDAFILVNGRYIKIGDDEIDLSDYADFNYVDRLISETQAMIPTNNNQLTNGAGYQTENEVKALVADSFQDGIEITVSGTTPTITANANTRYICGEVTSLTVTPPANGVTEIVFSSGTTPTTLTLPATVHMPEWFTIESGYTYAISIENATYGSVASWQT